MTTFLGREQDLAEVRELLARQRLLKAGTLVFV